MGAYNGIDESNLTGASIQGALRSAQGFFNGLSYFSKENKAKRELENKRVELANKVTDEGIQQQNALDAAQVWLQEKADANTAIDNGDEFAEYSPMPTDVITRRILQQKRATSALNEATIEESKYRKTLAENKNKALKNMYSWQGVLNDMDSAGANPSSKADYLFGALKKAKSKKEKNIINDKLIELGNIIDAKRSKQVADRLAAEDYEKQVENNSVAKARGFSSASDAEGFDKQIGAADSFFSSLSETGDPKDIKEGTQAGVIYQYYNTLKKSNKMPPNMTDDMNRLTLYSSMITELSDKGYYTLPTGERIEGVRDPEYYLNAKKALAEINANILEAGNDGDVSALTTANAALLPLLNDDIAAAQNRETEKRRKVVVAEQHKNVINNSGNKGAAEVYSNATTEEQQRVVATATLLGVNLKLFPKKPNDRRVLTEMMGYILDSENLDMPKLNDMLSSGKSDDIEKFIYDNFIPSGSGKSHIAIDKKAMDILKDTLRARVKKDYVITSGNKKEQSGIIGSMYRDGQVNRNVFRNPEKYAGVGAVINPDVGIGGETAAYIPTIDAGSGTKIGVNGNKFYIFDGKKAVQVKLGNIWNDPNTLAKLVYGDKGDASAEFAEYNEQEKYDKRQNELLIVGDEAFTGHYIERINKIVSDLNSLGKKINSGRATVHELNMFKNIRTMLRTMPNIGTMLSHGDDIANSEYVEQLASDASDGLFSAASSVMRNIGNVFVRDIAGINRNVRPDVRSFVLMRAELMDKMLKLSSTYGDRRIVKPTDAPRVPNTILGSSISDIGHQLDIMYQAKQQKVVNDAVESATKKNADAERARSIREQSSGFNPYKIGKK